MKIHTFASIVLSAATLLLCASGSFAADSSHVQLYDGSGTNKTGKIGWAGDNASGHLFIRTPNDRSGVKVQQGIVTAEKFVGEVDGLQQTLDAKADKADVTTLQTQLNAKATTAELTTINTTLSSKADQSKVTTLEATLTNKADKTQLDALEASTAPKASPTFTGHVKADSLTVAKIMVNTLCDQNGTCKQVSEIGASVGGNYVAIGQNAGGDLSGTYPNPTIGSSKVDSTHIKDGSIISADIKDGTISSADIKDGSITDSDVSSLSYTKLTGTPSSLPISGTAGGDLSGTYPNPTIGSSKVDSTHIKDGSIISADIKDGTISSADIKDGSITDSDVSSLSYSKLTGTPSSLPISGTAGGDLSGTYPNPTIGSSKVDSTHIKDGSIISADIKDGTISNTDISSSANISGSKINPDFRGSEMRVGGGYGHSLRFHSTSSWAESFLIDPSADSNDEYLAFYANDGNNSMVNMLRFYRSNKAALFYGTIFTPTGTVSASDKRLKTDIFPVTGGLDIISQLEGVYYTWKKDVKERPAPDSSRHIGFIAQDVKKVLPELVRNAPDGYLAVEYDKLAAVLVEATKEQQKIIDDQGDKINSLEQQLYLQQQQIQLLVKQVAKIEAKE